MVDDITFLNFMICLNITLGVIYTLVGEETLKFKLNVLVFQILLFYLVLAGTYFSAMITLVPFIFTKGIIKKIWENNSEQ